MSNVPHSGGQSVPTGQTVSSRSNSDAPTQNGQPKVLTEEQKEKRRERNKRRKQNRQRKKEVARNAASSGPALESKPLKQPIKLPNKPVESKPPKPRNEPPNKQVKLAITPVIPKPTIVVPKPPELQFPRFKDFPLWIQRHIFEMAYDAHTNCIGWGNPEDSEYWAGISNQVNEW